MTVEVPQIEWDDKLSPFEYMMYRADGDLHSRSTMSAIETLDVTPEWGRLRDELDRVSRLVPRLRQHVVAPVVPVAPARWVIDPDFNLGYHLRRVSLPGRAGLRELLDFAETAHATPLDPTRPLWELILVEGLDLPDAEAALIWKLSHSVTDGTGGVLLDRLMRHDERDPDLGPMPPIPSPEDVTPVELTRSGLRRLPLSLAGFAARRVTRAIGDVRDAVQAPSETVGRAVKSVSAIRRMAPGGVAAPSPLLARRSVNRRFEAMKFPLNDLRLPAKAHGFSVNDAYVAGISGALRLYHEHFGVPVDVVPLGMPINIRAADAAGRGANEWSAATLPAPVGIADPVARMQRVRELVLTARSDAGMNAAAMIAPITNWLPNAIISSMQPNLGIDVQASSVPGHPKPRHLAGARIVQSIPMGPAPGVALMVTMISMAGECHVGINYDTASITDPDVFRDCLERGFAEVFDVEPPDEKAPAKKKTAAKRKTVAKKKAAAKKRAPAKKRAAATRGTNGS